jgi:hypothetical protein
MRLSIEEIPLGQRYHDLRTLYPLWAMLLLIFITGIIADEILSENKIKK